MMMSNMHKIGYHPETGKRLFHVRDERMKLYETIQNEETRYWFALEDWLDLIDIQCWYSSMPPDFTELAQLSRQKLTEAILRDGAEALGEFTLIAEELKAKASKVL